MPKRWKRLTDVGTAARIGPRMEAAEMAADVAAGVTTLVATATAPSEAVVLEMAPADLGAAQVDRGPDGEIGLQGLKAAWWLALGASLAGHGRRWLETGCRSRCSSGFLSWFLNRFLFCSHIYKACLGWSWDMCVKDCLTGPCVWPRENL